MSYSKSGNSVNEDGRCMMSTLDEHCRLAIVGTLGMTMHWLGVGRGIENKR